MSIPAPHLAPRSTSDEWLTPPALLAALGVFDFDPCAPVNPPWQTAATMLTIVDDGLAQPWHGRVWLNPPFGRGVARWLARLVEHGDGIALLPARTETQPWHRYVWGVADAVLFMRGRPRFYRVDGSQARHNCGAAIALVAYGLDNVAALRCSGLGALVDARSAVPA